ncbi:MAG TPA: ADOP family duplicated permease [Lacunisphaera sp.]|jgi:predicted permease|nr:ADOP family duplicated permease [Lacunisphaera sp.]
MKLLPRLRALFRQEELDAEMAEEMRQHLELQAERNRAAGMDPDEARYAAERQFGNVASVQERVRWQRGWTRLELFAKEIGFAARALRRAPAFSLAVLTTLALCLGPNVAILSALYTFVYKPLPFPHPDRLVSITNVSDRLGGAKRPSSIPQYQDFVAHADLFEGLVYFSSITATLGNVEEPVRIFGMNVSPNFLGAVGIPILLGRGFRPDEIQPGRERVLVLSHGAWLARFRGDPQVVGRVIRLDDVPYSIVGVAAPSIEMLFNDVEFFRPRVQVPVDLDARFRYSASVRVLARLKPGVPIAMAQEQLAILERNFLDSVASPADRAKIAANHFHVDVADARREMAAPLRAPLWMLQGGALLVLLLGCVNVASLLLARTSAQRQELAIRQALGAGRGTLLRQMLAESVLLMGTAGVVGLGVALAMLRFMNAYLSLVVRHVPPMELETPVLFLVLGIVSVLVIVMALVPFGFWRAADLKPSESPHASMGRRGRRTIGILSIGQLALALVLLVGAGLMLHSFARVLAVRPGFDAARVIQGRIYLPPARFASPPELLGVQQRIMAALGAVPGVDAVGLSADFPVQEKFNTMPFVVHDASAATGQERAFVYTSGVSAGYFATMGIPLRDGRLFREDDDMRKTPVAVVDETFVRRFFPGRNVVGMEFAFGTSPPSADRPWIRIVGVVARANLSGLEGRDGWPFVYLPFNQQATTAFTFLVRTSRPETDIVREVRERVRTIDAGLPVYGVGSLQGALDYLLGNRRALLVLIGLFAGLALLLAAVGLFGVLNFDVAQRTREIGIRGALGASRRQILSLVLQQGLAKVAAGLVLGIAGAILFTRLLSRMLFDVSAADPLAYGGVVALLFVVGLAASWLPARRAAKVDLVVALRAE